DPLGPPDGDDVQVVADDGARLAASIVGAAGGGPTVVLSHCWTGGRAVWAPVARRLVEGGHRVVLYDQRGHGRSERGAAPLTVDVLGDDLRAVVEQLDVRDAVLAGHSMGGMSVMSLACRRPDVVRARARGLALVATAAHGITAGRLEPVARRVLRAGLLERALARPGGVLLLRSVVGEVVVRGHLELVRELFLATPADVRSDCFAAMCAMDLRAGLAEIDMPVTVMVGTHDTLTREPLGRAIAGLVPGSRVEVLPGAGHMLPLERPDAVAAAIGSLAARVSDAA
ncbi:MAG TPA: alpha/beta fold hydrolase, partial [Acidimicrobiales bacterium]